MNCKILTSALPNIPWEERPAGSSELMWRYSGNPVIRPDGIRNANSIFNSAVVPFGDAYAGVFRVDDTCRIQRLHAGFSADGVHWKIEDDPIVFEGGQVFEYGYDPRVCRIGDDYWVTWCNGFHGQPTIGIAVTRDFKTFTQKENAFLPFNRNGVLFPRKINGKYAMFSRPSDPGHTPFGDIYLSFSPDMVHWGEHKLVMSPTRGWQALKIGAGPIPIETDRGWLLFYHGVLLSCNGYVYSMGAALFDLEEPWKVIARTDAYLMAPKMDYERVGDVPNVVFPCAALVDGATGRIAVYYGAADTVTGLAFCRAEEILAHLLKQK